MNLDLSVLLKKYLIALIISLLGIYAMVVGVKTSQEPIFIVAAGFLFLGGIMAMLFSAGILKRNLVIVIGFVFIGFIIFFGYTSITSITDAQKHMEDRERSEQLVRYNLGLIRDIQRKHKEEFGRYAATWEELEEFFNIGKITVIESEMPVPTRPLKKEEIKVLYGDNRAADINMTEREAALLALAGNPSGSEDLVGFRRDTVKKLFQDDYMGAVSRIKERQRLGLGPFKIERLRFVPMSIPEMEWIMETRENVPYSGDTIPTIKVSALEPVPVLMDGKKMEIGFGSLITNSDKATWE